MKYKQEEIHVWHLETQAPTAPDTSIERSYQLQQVTTPWPELSRFMYLTVGAPWIWYMRLNWTYRQWQEELAKPSVETWIAWADGSPIGYFELERQPASVVEICYFGLVPQFIGKGYGRPMLEDALTVAWQGATERVWLHTCSLDHPSALSNYLARGFTVFKEEDFVDKIPSEPIQPWTGADKPLA